MNLRLFDILFQTGQSIISAYSQFLFQNIIREAFLDGRIEYGKRSAGRKQLSGNRNISTGIYDIGKLGDIIFVVDLDER